MFCGNLEESRHKSPLWLILTKAKSFETLKPFSEKLAFANLSAFSFCNISTYFKQFWIATYH